MAWAKQLPWNESLAVFLGVAGFDWLNDGHAEIVRAIAAGLLTGLVLIVVRRLRQKPPARNIRPG